MTKTPSSHYPPFGSTLPSRSWSDASRAYRYGFNGKEKDSEGMGGGTSTYDYGFRIYNPSLGKFLSVDPLFYSYPWNSSYAFAENVPISGIDLEGLEYYYASDGTFLRQGANSTDKSVYKEYEVKEKVIVRYKYEKKTAPPSSNSSQEKFIYVKTPVYEEKIVKKQIKIHDDHDGFLDLAGYAYNENTSNADAQKATLGMLNNRVDADVLYYGYDNINSINDAVNQIFNKKSNGKNNPIFKNYKKFINTSKEERNNNVGMKSSIEAAIHVLSKGKDYSNGALFEHGKDFYIKSSKYPRAFNEAHERGWEYQEGGEFNGTFNPKSYPSRIGTDGKNNPFIITASIGGNVYAKLKPQKKPKNK